MITRVTIEHWKSFKQTTLPIAPLTLLIGANASGKSNAVEAIRCLSWLAEGRRVSEIMSAFQESEQAIRGSIRTLGYRGGDLFMLGCDTDDPDWNRYRISVEVDEDGFRISGERLEGPASKVPLFDADWVTGSEREPLVEYNRLHEKGGTSTVPASDEQSVLSQLTTPARFAAADGKAQEVITDTAKRFRTALAQMLFLDPNPQVMRRYSFDFDKQLKGDGANLSSVLFHLCGEPGIKARILDFVRALPEQDIVDLSFVHTSRREVMVQLAESFVERKETWDASTLSDGTLRVLAVAAALFSAPDGSLVIIEEIDNGVHPSRAGLLIQNIERVAIERGLRVLLTTHNPALVDALPADATPNIVYCYRDPVEGDSRLVRLEDLPNYPELVARGPLGQLMTRGILERMVKQPPSTEERKRAASDWLNSLGEQARSA